MTIVTRFPPSPTGFMHIGNARTALFNWLYARAKGGKFLVRIEDTDRKRHSEKAVEAIFRGLEWLGLDYDGEAVSQHARIDRHREVAQDLLDKGMAYKCYCTAEELEDMRETAKTEGRPTAYDKRWRDRTDHPEGQDYVVRIKAPLDGETIINDEVQGQVTVKNEQIDDFVILRSDGSPTYMLAVVVDDHDMDVTHIIRGDDHLNNAFRQKVILDALGWDVPTYTHTPLIHGPDGKKFSKRHGAEGVEDYKDLGILSDALFNYLLRLGWSHGDDEIISREQALEWFDLDGLGKSPASFDTQKLENLNAHYIKQADADTLLAQTAPFIEGEISEQSKQWIIEGIDELKDRSKTLIEFANEIQIYMGKPDLTQEEKASQLIADNQEMLKTILDTFQSMDIFDKDAVMNASKTIAKEHADGKLGKIGMPLRAALTGRTSSPGIFDVAAILGKDETCARIQSALTA